ncbi:MAG TPA: translocation/assembly module TamB domain-containing protein [Polyangiales bacterium]|nr:translocation/assembly module TamB domain-containing protein [Polyangiales bacterium]
MRWLAWVGWLAAAVFALAASAVYHAQLPIAHRIVRDAVNNFVTGEIRGELAIGRLDKITLGHIVARYVSLYDAQGRRVIAADRVDLYPDFSALAANTLRFRVARLQHGFVRMVDEEEGTPSWISGLSPKVPGDGTGNPLRALLEEIEVSDVTVYGQYLGLEGFRVEDVDARGRLEIHRDVNVRIHSGHGRFVLPFPYPGFVDEVTGVIDTDPMRGVDLHVVARRDRTAEPPPDAAAVAPREPPPTEERATAHVTFKSSAPALPQELHIEIASEQVTPDTLRGLGYTWLGPIEPALRGQVLLFGPPESLSLESNVESPAGNVRVSGTISREHGVSVHAVSDAIEVEGMLQNAPALTLRGAFHVAIAPEEEALPHVHVELGATRYKGLTIPAFELDGVIEADRLVIERARSSAGGRLSVKGSVGFDGGTDLRVDANLPAVNRDPNLAQYVGGLQGQLQAALHIQVPAGGGSFDVEGKLQLLDASYDKITATRVTVEGAARGDPSLPQLDVQVRGEAVYVLGYALGTASFSLQGGPNSYHAQGEFAPNPGQKTFYFDAQIAATRKQFVIQADPIEFVFGDKVFRGAARDLTIVGGQQVSLTSLRLASASERLEVSGTVRTRGQDDVRADLQNFDLGALHALLGDSFPLAEGHADATVELQGDLSRPDLTVQGAIRGGRVLDVPNVDAMFFVAYQNGQLDLDQQVEIGGRGSLHLSGTGKLNPAIADPLRALQSGKYELELSSTDFDLLAIPRLRSALHSGRITGTVQAQGSLDAPSVSGNASVASLCLVNMRPVDVAAEFDYDAARARAQLHVSDGGGKLAELSAEALVAWKALRDAPGEALRNVATGQWQLRGDTEARPLIALPFEVPTALQVPAGIASTFLFEHTAAGVRGNMRFNGQGIQVFTDEACKLSGNSRFSAAFDVTPDLMTASFRGSLDGNRVLDGSGRFQVPLEAWLRGDEPLRIARADINAHADIADIERLPLLCQHGHGDLQVDARFDALFTPAQRVQIDVSGSLNPHVRVLEGRQRRVVESCRDDPARVWLQAKVDGKQASAQGWLEGCYGGHSDLVVNVPLRWDATGLTVDGDRDTRVQVDFGEAQLRPLLDRTPGVLGFGAIASGRLVAVGNKRRVAYTGKVDVSEGKLYLLSTGQELKDIQGVFTANGSWVKIEGLAARAGSGALEAAGGIGFDRWSPDRVQLGLVLKNLAVQREGLDLASLNGSAAITTQIGADHAQSAVKLHALTIRLPETTSRSLQALDPHPDVRVTTDKAKPVASKPYTFDFAIDGRRGVTAMRNDFNVTIALELAVRYADPDLNVGGYVEFRRGSFEVFGKQFDVNHGSLTFSGSSELNPGVNLTATQRPEAGAGSSQGVVARVSGTLANPRVEFFSETCPGQGAIVQLVSGRCPSEADSTVQDSAATQDAFAAGVVGGILTLGTRSQLGGLIPRISVESTGQGKQARVKAGFEAVPKFMRPLVQRVYVQGAVSTKDESSQSSESANQGATPDFLIELYFPHNIVGSGKVAPITRSWGLDVTWEP